MGRLFKILLCLDNLIGNLIFKNIYPDESISAYVYRTKKTRWIAFVNWLMRNKNHCAEAYQSEQLGTQNAPEYRQ